MNKMLIAVFNSETAAEAGVLALHRLHANGDITLYAKGLMVKDQAGGFTVKMAMDQGPVTMVNGLAVGSLVSLLGASRGALVGPGRGSVVSAMRDFWMAGVGLDFVEEAEGFLLPGKAALVVEIEEECVIPVDNVLESVGGHVLRRGRCELAEAQFDHDITVLKSEIKELETEALHATGAAKAKLHIKLAKAESSLERAEHRAKRRVDALKHEAHAKEESLKAQLAQAKDSVKSKVEDRVKRVKTVYHARSAKLSQAWGLTKEALTL